MNLLLFDNPFLLIIKTPRPDPISHIIRIIGALNIVFVGHVHDGVGINGLDRLVVTQYTMHDDGTMLTIRGTSCCSTSLLPPLHRDGRIKTIINLGLIL